MECSGLTENLDATLFVIRRRLHDGIRRAKQDYVRHVIPGIIPFVEPDSGKSLWIGIQTSGDLFPVMMSISGDQGRDR